MAVDTSGEVSRLSKQLVIELSIVKNQFEKALKTEEKKNIIIKKRKRRLGIRTWGEE